MVEFNISKYNFLSFTSKNKAIFKSLTSLNNFNLKNDNKNYKQFLVILLIQKKQLF